MTKDEIIAELRRSATEDESPYWMIRDLALEEAIRWKDKPARQAIVVLPADYCRTFFLLVAEALES